jgi:hypothetical protein
MSLCMALNSAASRQGILLPLVLDDPFVRLDARRTASLAAVLAAFSQQGHQIIVFTGQQVAAQRLASVGAVVRNIADLRERDPERGAEEVPVSAPQINTEPSQRPKARRRKVSAKRDSSRRQALNGKAAEPDQSDAA